MVCIKGGDVCDQGQGAIGDDDFLIQDESSDLAELFMHELGYNLRLIDNGDNGKAIKGTAGYSGRLDYVSNDWSAINLALVHDTSYNSDQGDLKIKIKRTKIYSFFKSSSSSSLNIKNVFNNPVSLSSPRLRNERRRVGFKRAAVSLIFNDIKYYQ